jgi:CBS domain-containing protein
MKCSKIMTKEPFHCLPEDTADTAARLMEKHGVGPLPVVESEATRQLVGILTDRDIVTRVVGEGKDPKNTMVKEVMTRELVSARPEDGIDKALSRMAEGRIRRLPVVDDEKRLVGIISQADLASHIEEPARAGEFLRAVSHS